ncbi:C4-dicarboxylate ABC transporter [Aquisalimonas sp. 2447]|uniref:SLAC1 anion channel family protein n=1 Tax=Aquisalimonas sp. 2447 TaxID=2740807 RepID=UPI001432430F|nr:SLAC1 anion channel family protein [Aquisalimonas sp. 2447]QIT55070.1 C4-dicarboxylate ABC transporter [Aquisalimonas sp. 2447]
MTEGRSPCSNLPLPLFAAVMGLSGLGLVWHAAESHWALTVPVSSLIGILSALVFVLLLAGYVCKAVNAPGAVLEEIRHPVRINFLPAISISLLLLGIQAQQVLPAASLWLWGSGAVLHLALTVGIVTRWLGGEQPVAAINPAWFIPAVGNVLVPLAAAPAGYLQLAWFFFATGMLFWVVLGVMVFHRLITGPALEPPMRPTLAVLVAPPSVAFLAWLAMTGEAGIGGTLLFYMAVITALLVLAQVPAFARLPFFPSWWAYTFPSAAFTVAVFRYTEATTVGGEALLVALTGAVTVLLIGISGMTLRAMYRGTLHA